MSNDTRKQSMHFIFSRMNKTTVFTERSYVVFFAVYKFSHATDLVESHQYVVVFKLFEQHVVRILVDAHDQLIIV